MLARSVAFFLKNSIGVRGGARLPRSMVPQLASFEATLVNGTNPLSGPEAKNLYSPLSDPEIRHKQRKESTKPLLSTLNPVAASPTGDPN